MECKKFIGEKKITQDEHEAIIKLKMSIYPTQENKYTILTVPKFHVHAGKYVPIDYDIMHIILNLWNLGIETVGTDQGCKCGTRVYINIKHNLVSSRESALLLLEKTFGKENIRLSYIFMNGHDTLTRQQKHDLNDTNKKVHANKIYFVVDYNIIRMSFKHEKISFINSLFKNGITSDNHCYDGKVFAMIKKDIFYDDFV